MAQDRDQELTNGARYRVPVLERALAILEYLDQHPAGRSMTEIARDLGLPKNAVFRITTTLTQCAYLERNSDTKRLYLSRKALTLGYGALQDERGIVQLAWGPMRCLRDRVKETVCLSILVDGQGFVLEAVPGIHPFRCVVDSGMRQPLHASGSCKAILAHLPEEEQAALISAARLVRLTQNTIRHKTALGEEMSRVRNNGYAVDDCEHIDGVRCVAAPIFDRHGHAVASLTVTGPMGRMPKADLPTLGHLVREHADQVSASMGRHQKDSQMLEVTL